MIQDHICFVSTIIRDSVVYDRFISNNHIITREREREQAHFSAQAY